MPDFDNITPKKIGNFNIPKNVIECKVDTLAFLELLLRKNICTWEEIEEIREAVVMHMNVMYPELQLSYSTPAPLNEQAPLTPPEEPKKPLYYNAPPPELSQTPTTSPEPQAAKPNIEQKPLYQTVQPPKILSNVPRNANIPPRTTQSSSAAPASQPQTANSSEQKQQVETQSQQNTQQNSRPPITPSPGAPRPMMPNSGPPKILNNPPRKNI